MEKIELQMLKGQSWNRGLTNLLKSELRSWWSSKKWWIQLIIWISIINLFTAWSILGDSSSTTEYAIQMFLIFSAMPVFGVIIVAQSLIIGEKFSGAAHWILSKPISRLAFIVAKFIGNLPGIIFTMVLASSIIFYFEMYAILKVWLPLGNFTLGILIIILFILFHFSLTLMLGTIFNNRGPVIGIALAIFMGQSFLSSFAPDTVKFIPWGLMIGVGEGKGSTAVPSIAESIMVGQNPQFISPIIIALVLTVLFLITAVLRFKREEL